MVSKAYTGFFFFTSNSNLIKILISESLEA